MACCFITFMVSYIILQVLWFDRWWIKMQHVRDTVMEKLWYHFENHYRTHTRLFISKLQVSYQQVATSWNCDQKQFRSTAATNRSWCPLLHPSLHQSKLVCWSKSMWLCNNNYIGWATALTRQTSLFKCKPMISTAAMTAWQSQSGHLV